MKFRLLAVIVLSTVIFFSSLVWLLDSFFYGDRGNWAEMTLRSQVSVTSEAISAEAKFLQRWVSTANEETLKKVNWSAFAPYVAVGILQKSPIGWIVSDWATEPKSNWSKQSKENFQVSLSTWGLKDFGKFVSFFSVVDSDKGPSVFSFIPVGERVWFFIHGGEALQSVIDSQKGSWSSLGIVTREGLTLAHATSEYIGQKMSKSTLQADLLKGETVSGSGNYRLGDSDVFAYFQKVPDVDSYVYATMPMMELMKGRKKLLIQLSLLALGLILVSSSLILRFTQNLQESNKPMTNEILGSELPSGYLVKTRPALEKTDTSLAVTHDKAVIQKEKMEAYSKMASAVGHELRSPLLAILSYAQSLLPKTADADSKKILEALVNEARTSRHILDKLFNFSGERVQDRTLMKIDTPLLRSLKNLEPLFNQKGVKINKELHETQAIHINADNMIRAFENILVNSVESMERQANKEIEIRLQDAGPKIELLIRDKGEGIETANLKKIFEPFYTTKSTRQQLGLGLSVSHGILKEHSAEVEVRSAPGQGTTFMISFEKAAHSAKAIPAAQKVEAVAENKSKRLNATEIRLDIPKYDDIQLDLAEEQQKNVNEETSTKSGVVEAPVSEDSKLIFHEPASKSANILQKPGSEGQSTARPSLDVNVDQLLDLPQLKPIDDKTVLTDSEPKNSAPKIDPPKKQIDVKKSSAEQFKVTIRRPERKG